MVNLETNTMHRDGKSSPIRSFVVWFRSPFGLSTSLEEAVQVCREQELDPNRAVQPITVAIDERDRYEEVYR